jgi:hypothetical protein
VRGPGQPTLDSTTCEGLINEYQRQPHRGQDRRTATVELPASESAAAKDIKSRLMKQAVVTMNNGEEFVFDYGLLSVKNLVAAIESISSR